jgi:RNA polymerase sigma factor (sigma-70 family)
MIDEIKKGDRKAVEKLYLEHRTGFLLFVRKYGIDQEEAADVYQDAVIALMENIKKGKLDHTQVEVKTYLYAIGKYMAMRRANKEVKRDTFLGEMYWEEAEEEETVLPDLGPALSRLGERCYQILKLFYYENKKLEEIQSQLTYSSKDVLKSQKSRCLKQLKELMSDGKNR